MEMRQKNVRITVCFNACGLLQARSCGLIQTVEAALSAQASAAASTSTQVDFTRRNTILHAFIFFINTCVFCPLGFMRHFLSKRPSGPLFFPPVDSIRLNYLIIFLANSQRIVN